MNLSNMLSHLFQVLNDENIRYFVMRDYDTAAHLNGGLDLDIVVNEADKRKLSDVLILNGWKPPKYNLCFYGHRQFFKWDADKNRVYKLDVLFGLNFGNGLYYMPYIENIFSKSAIVNGIRIPDFADGLLIHLCHIVFDKKSLLTKNKSFLRYLMSHIEYKKYPEIECIAKRVLESDNNIDVIHQLSGDIISSGFVNRRSKWYCSLRWLFIRAFAKVFSKKSISVAVIGVDGSGKSTSVDALKEYYGDNIYSQYFGFRAYETSLAKYIYAHHKHVPILSFLVDCIVLPYEMLFRYRKAYKSGKRVLVFDRYPWEAYDNTKGKVARFVNYLLFKLPFKRPDGIVYLHCPVDVSLSRKDDIHDVSAFSEMKTHFDKVYMNIPNTLVIDTSVCSKADVKSKTIEYLAILESTNI